MSPIPLLFIGDSPSLSTGLARIGRDLATLTSRLPQFRVAYLGRGAGADTNAGIADSRLPFFQYTYQPTAADQWGESVLADVWRNWSRGERGVIMTIWDLSRLTWFGNPIDTGNAALYETLTSDQFERWGYFAVDAEGPGEGGALPQMLSEALAGYDRVLAYSRFGKRVLEATLRRPRATTFSGEAVDWLPHGYVHEAFQPRDRAQARLRFMGGACIGTAAPDVRLIGCVMANQPRKDWGLWARSMKLVCDRLPNVGLWAHTDSIDRYWDLRILMDEFGLTTRTLVTLDNPSDEEMSWRYSACDLTVLPSLGEGFGYPIIESMACGVPVIHGNVAGGAELIPDTPLLVEPDMFTMDTRWCVMRPVFSPERWAQAIVDTLMYGPMAIPSRQFPEFVQHLRWSELWPRAWEKWFVRGAEQFESASANEATR